MKVKLREVREGSEALSKVLGTPRSATGSYRLSKLTAKLIAENKHIEKTRVELVKKYGDEDKDGRITVGPKRETEFNAEWDAFLDGEVDLGNVWQIPFGMLLGIRITAIDMANIAPFVVEPTEDEIKAFEAEELAEAANSKETEKPPRPPMPPTGRR